ncbi:MAG: IS1634 family transposase [Bacteroidota bacterium]
MFLRKKPNKSGSVSIQVIQKVGRSNKVVTTIGCSSDPFEIEQLWIKGKTYISKRLGQTSLPLFEQDTEQWFATVFSSIEKIEWVGPELILGKLFDEIGFDTVPEPLFRHLVLSRIIDPSSKLKTARAIERFYGVKYSTDRIYRYLDKVASTLKETLQQISYEHTLKILDGMMSMVFYDVTTIYFEAEREDNLRIAGFSKEGKHQHPQILLGLLVSNDGYPLAYDIFPGNTYEGHTMLPVLDYFKTKYSLDKLIVIADAGLLTNKNMEELMEKGYEYVLGARIKTESKAIKTKILEKPLQEGQHIIIPKGNTNRLIVHYSAQRAKKDKYNRDRGLKRLEKDLKNNKLTKSHVNNKGYNKYLILEGDLTISIDYTKHEEDAGWDGLKGYITNTTYDPRILLKNYAELWKIEKAFRISKTDLRIRPIYHRLRNRIEAHICISFVAYKIYKELERQLALKQSGISVARAIEIMKTIQQLTITHPESKKSKSQLLKPTASQIKLIKLFEN